MADLTVSVPLSRVSSRRVETNPTYARAWLASLSPYSNPDSVQELYQNLYALNRIDLDPAQRFELMQLHQTPIQEALSAYQGAFSRASFPMQVNLRRLAEFVCQINIEQANGYKLVVRDLPKIWLPWKRWHLFAPATERALHHLGEILLRSYQLYLPYPPGIWRDAHTLYRFAETHKRHEEVVQADEKGSGIIEMTVSRRYRRLLMLGIANPYQMSFGECDLAYRFVGHWVEQTRIVSSLSRPGTQGCFLIDSKIDSPPSVLPRWPIGNESSELRIFDANEFVTTLQLFIERLQQGETAKDLRLGVDCLDATCKEMLQRLHREYFQAAGRRHSRIKRDETVSVCAGISAVHFFAGGQKAFNASSNQEDTPFNAKDATSELPTTEAESIETKEEDYVALDNAENPYAASRDTFRVDVWQVRDVSAQGLLMAHANEPGAKFRVGEILGIQRTTASGQWNVGVVRWFKGQGAKGIEMGVELIAPEVTSVSVWAANGDQPRMAVAALWMPAIEATHSPASLLTPRGALQIGKDYFLAETDRATRRIRVLDVIERTGSAEKVIVGNVIG